MLWSGSFAIYLSMNDAINPHIRSVFQSIGLTVCPETLGGRLSANKVGLLPVGCSPPSVGRFLLKTDTYNVRPDVRFGP